MDNHNDTLTLPRIRSAKEAFAEVKALDPNTALKLHHLQRLIKTGVVPTIRAGNRLFVNFDMLVEYIATHPALDLSDTQEVEGIRPVPERIRR